MSTPTFGSTSRYTGAVIGGTGPQGKGLGYRFARHGHDIVLGSRAADKAAVAASEAAESAAELAPEATVVGAFHNLAASALWGEDDFLDEDVIVVGDSAEGKQVAIDLAASVTGRPGVDGGATVLGNVGKARRCVGGRRFLPEARTRLGAEILSRSQLARFHDAGSGRVDATGRCDSCESPYGRSTRQVVAVEEMPRSFAWAAASNRSLT